MFSDTQLKARELKLDIKAIATQHCTSAGKIQYISAQMVKKANRISDEVDLKGHADEYEIEELSEMLKDLKRWSRGARS